MTAIKTRSKTYYRKIYFVFGKPGGVRFPKNKMWQNLSVTTLVCGLLMGGCRGGQANPFLKQGLESKLPSQLQGWMEQRSTPQATPALFPAETEIALATALERYTKTAKLPGAVVGIASPQRSWLKAAGQSDLADQTALQPTDRFRIGDLSELFMAVICLQLAEEEILSLNDPITDWLPAEQHRRIPGAAKTKIRQLLNHTSALPDLDTAAFRQAVDVDQLLAFISTQPVTRPKGVYTRSAVNYLLLQEIIERATGDSLAKAVQQRIAEPLKLKNTYVELSATKTIAHGYQDWNGDGSRDDVTQPLINTGLGLGGKAMISTAPELMQFLQALFLGDRLLNADSQQKMLTLVEMRRGGYGLGILNSLTRWGEMWGQVDNATTGFSAVLFYLPVHDLVIVAWTNEFDESTDHALTLMEKSLGIALGNSVKSSGATIQW
jgi:D-alanyl-D-alanine carboxypeptidase